MAWECTKSWMVWEPVRVLAASADGSRIVVGAGSSVSVFDANVCLFIPLPVPPPAHSAAVLEGEAEEPLVEVESGEKVRSASVGKLDVGLLELTPVARGRMAEVLAVGLGDGSIVIHSLTTGSLCSPSTGFLERTMSWCR